VFSSQILCSQTTTALFNFDSFVAQVVNIVWKISVPRPCSFKLFLGFWIMGMRELYTGAGDADGG
jgi:hypothetical protein